jgi:hypothetical protein
MGRVIPLLPPLALVLLVIGASADAIVRFANWDVLLRGLPLLAIAVAYVWVGRRNPAR